MARLRSRTLATVPARILALSFLLLAGAAITHGSQAKDDKQTPQIKGGVVDEKTIVVLIAQLGDEDFDKREAAHKLLAEIGEPALPLLAKAAKDSADAEIRQRAGKLISTIEKSFFALVRQIEAHPRARLRWVTRVVVTADGKKAISAGMDDGLRLWDLASGKMLLSFGMMQGNYWGLAVCPDGKRLLATGDGITALVFDIQTGKQLKDFRGHQNQVWGAVWLPGGKHVLTGAWDKSLRIWDADSGAEVRTFDGVQDNIRCLALSPNGKVAAAGHFGVTNGPGRVRLWDVEKGREIRVFDELQKEVSSVAFSPDGKSIVSGGFDKSVTLWDATTGKVLQRFTGHQGRVLDVAFSQDGKNIFSCGDEKNPSLRIWDVESGRQIVESVEVTGGVNCVTMLPGTRQCLTTGKDSQVRFWEWKH